MIRHPLAPLSPPEPPPEDIRTCAYYLWEAAGRPGGRDQEFWFGARARLHRLRAGRRPGQELRKGGQEARRCGGRLRLC